MFTKIWQKGMLSFFGPISEVVLKLNQIKLKLFTKYSVDLWYCV
jgi:hypothetical protein